MTFARMVEWTGWTVFAAAAVGGVYVGTEAFVGPRVANITALAVAGLVLATVGINIRENGNEGYEPGDSP